VNYDSYIESRAFEDEYLEERRKRRERQEERAEMREEECGGCRRLMTVSGVRYCKGPLSDGARVTLTPVARIRGCARFDPMGGYRSTCDTESPIQDGALTHVLEARRRDALGEGGEA
jgi:hypothetical protein